MIFFFYCLFSYFLSGCSAVYLWTTYDTAFLCHPGKLSPRKGLSKACGQESRLRKNGLGRGGHRETGPRHWAGHTVAPVNDREAVAVMESCGVAPRILWVRTGVQVQENKCPKVWTQLIDSPVVGILWQLPLLLHPTPDYLPVWTPELVCIPVCPQRSPCCGNGGYPPLP